MSNDNATKGDVMEYTHVVIAFDKDETPICRPYKSEQTANEAVYRVRNAFEFKQAFRLVPVNAHPARTADKDCSVEKMVDHLHDSMQFFDESGNQANDIVCAEIGLRLRQYFNAEASGREANRPSALTPAQGGYIGEAPANRDVADLLRPYIGQQISKDLLTDITEQLTRCFAPLDPEIRVWTELDEIPVWKRGLLRVFRNRRYWELKTAIKCEVTTSRVKPANAISMELSA